MTEWTTPLDRIDRACAELRRGAAVLLRGEGGGALAVSAEAARPQTLAAMRAEGGALYAALTARRAQVLRIRAYDTDVARAILPADASPALIRALADPALDMTWPMKGPLAAMRGGSAEPARLAAALCLRAGLLPAAALCDGDWDAAWAAARGVAMLDMADAAALSAPVGVAEVARAQVPLGLAEDARLIGFRPSTGGPDHYAILIGDPPRGEPVLTRLHSECFTGDLLGSLKCDCGPQLRAALARIKAEGGGVLLYLAQEGRGIGLSNKLRAYALQDQGFDTVEANHRLGFEDDHRDFAVAGAMLRALGFSALRLMTNNPRKIAAMQAQGFAVARAPHAMGANPHNAQYLATKAAKSGHLL